MSEAKKIRIFSVDDHPIVRLGLRALIETTPDLELVGESSDAAAAVDLVEATRPDVTLVDLRMPGMGGIEFIAALRKRIPGAKAIVLTSFENEEDVFRAIQAGAHGYVLKSDFRETIVEAVRSVNAGERYLPPRLAGRLATRNAAPALSDREVEVLRLVAKGFSNVEIGGALHIAESTVKNHVRSIFDKLEASDRTEAVTIAIRKGIIQPD
jgi:two-component system, NarL family, response regulator